MIIPVSIPTPLINREICFLRNSFSRGFWHRDDSQDFELPLMMLQISLLFVLSATLQWLLRPFRQSRFVCNVLAGIIMGPSVLGRHEKFRALIFQPRGNYIMDIAWVIGAIYFAFLTSVKTETSMIIKTAMTSWNITLVTFVFPFCTIFSLIHALKLKFKARFFPVYAAASLSQTHFIVVASALHELNLMTSEVGQLALSWAIVYDAINLVVVIGIAVVSEDRLVHSIGVLVSVIAFVAVSLFVIRPAVLMIIRNTPEGKPVREIYIIAIYTVVAVMSVVLNLIGLPIVYGGLILGFFIPDGPPLGSTLTDKADSIISDVFLPLLYVRVGYEIDIYSIKDWRLFFAFQFIIFAAYCAKFLGTLLAAVYSDILLKNAILLSFIMSMKGIVEVFIYKRWLSFQFIDSQTFTQLMLSMLGLVMIVTPIVDIGCKPQLRLDHQTMRQTGIRSIQRGYYNLEFRIISCIHSQDNVRSIISLLQGSNPTEASPLSVYVIHLIELVGRAAPIFVRHDKRSRRSKKGNSVNSNYIMRAFENFSKNSSNSVAIQPFVLIAPYKTMHECIYKLALDNFIPFIIVPFHEYQRLGVDNRATASIRHFNTSLQASATCTVGILVDRSFDSHLKPAKFSYSVAVIFIGGADDREALAFASRMSGVPTVNITVIQFIFSRTENNMYDEGRKQDEFLMDEFKTKNRSNPRVEVREIVVNDGVNLIDSLRCIENSYDLMMVGRRQGNALPLAAEMSEFVENPELGAVGDMLASSDICGGEASVLVMQHAFPIDGYHSVIFSDDGEKP